MHASGAGYADLASHVMQMLHLPHTAKDREQLFLRGFLDDTMLSNYPPELNGLIRLIDIARTLIHANHFVPDPDSILKDETHLAVSLPLLARFFSR